MQICESAADLKLQKMRNESHVFFWFSSSQLKSTDASPPIQPALTLAVGPTARGHIRWCARICAFIRLLVQNLIPNLVLIFNFD